MYVGDTRQTSTPPRLCSYLNPTSIGLDPGEDTIPALGMPRGTGSLLERAQAAGLLPQENASNATGYAGVLEVKGRFEARVWDRVAKKQRPVGCFSTAREAGLALAQAKRDAASAAARGQKLASPAKQRKSRRPSPYSASMPFAIATPLTASASASARMPLAHVQPLVWSMPSMSATSEASMPSVPCYTAPESWEVRRS